MKGYYCIYECSQNKWLLNDFGDWGMDRNYHTISIGSKHAIQVSQNYGYTPNGGTQVDIIDTEQTAVLADFGNRMNPESIKKFETLSEAENYLTTFTSENGQFYSIRKIYF